MEFRVEIQPNDETTPAEIAGLSLALRQRIDRIAGIEHVTQVRDAAPEGAKGIVAELGSFIIGMPAGAVTGVLEVIKAMINRPGGLPVPFKITRDGIEGSFDPKNVTPDQFAALAEKLSKTIEHG